MVHLELLFSGNRGWPRAKAEEEDEEADSRSRMLTDDVRGWGAGRPALLYF